MKPLSSLLPLGWILSAAAFLPGQAMALDHRPLADVHLTGLHLAGLSPRLWSHATGPISELIV